jgi:hypothetical protein
MSSKENGTAGHGYISKAATSFARRKLKSPFAELVHCLNPKWNDDIRYAALQLINCLIVKSPSEKKLAQFLARLENIGLYNELQTMSTIKNNPKILAQLQNFQVSTKQILPSMQFENEVHKSRVKQLNHHIEILERKVESYEEQQSLFALMKGDLKKFKNAYDQAVESETMFSPFTPSEKHKDRVEEKKTKHGIIDLQKVMNETNSQFKEFKDKEKQLKDKITELDLAK